MSDKNGSKRQNKPKPVKITISSVRQKVNHLMKLAEKDAKFDWVEALSEIWYDLRELEKREGE